MSSAIALIILLSIFPVLHTGLSAADAQTWARSYGGSGDEFVFRGVVTGSDGGYVIAGLTNSSGAGIRDICSIKLVSSCGLGGCSTDVSVQPTTAPIKNSNAIPVDTNVIENDTGATANDSNAIVLDTFATVETVPSCMRQLGQLLQY